MGACQKELDEFADQLRSQNSLRIKVPLSPAPTSFAWRHTAASDVTQGHNRCLHAPWALGRLQRRPLRWLAQVETAAQAKEAEAAQAQASLAEQLGGVRGGVASLQAQLSAARSYSSQLDDRLQAATEQAVDMGRQLMAKEKVRPACRPSSGKTLKCFGRCWGGTGSGVVLSCSC